MLRQYLYLIAPICGWLVAQGAKYMLGMRGKHKDGFDAGALIRSGGMPSSHVAFMSSLTSVIGLQEGFASAAFGICLALTGVIGYDATGVRRTTGEQTRAIHELEKVASHKLTLIIHDARGHILPEIIGGAITGGVVGLALYVFL